MVSGLAPGRLADDRDGREIGVGQGGDGQQRVGRAPNTSRPSIISEVAIGRRMYLSERSHGPPPRASFTTARGWRAVAAARTGVDLRPRAVGQPVLAVDGHLLAGADAAQMTAMPSWVPPSSRGRRSAVPSGFTT